MPFDPTLPTEFTLADAAQMRAQFNGLNDLISAIPAGPQGVPGPQGPPFAGALVDGVSTLNPGDPATVGASFDGTNVHFTFGIPRGADGVNGINGANGADGVPGPQGTPGIPGSNGADGAPGTQGPQGPAFASAVVDGVNTLNPGDPATVNASFDGTNVRFTFGIPRGADGAPGEVSNAAFAAAIAGTPSNANGVALLGLAVSDPPTQAEMQAIASKLDELINALRR